VKLLALALRVTPTATRLALAKEQSLWLYSVAKANKIIST